MRTLRTLQEPSYDGPRPPDLSAGRWGAQVEGPMPWGHFVYQFFDADDRLLYVGITERISYRWSSHGRKAWWKDVARAEVFAMESRFDARDTERWVIKTNDPIHNLAQKERR